MATSNEARTASAASGANTSPTNSTKASGDGTLSKAALYVSLAAYNQMDPIGYMRTQSSTPRSIHESSLIDFWQKVSERYHRSSSSISKNTAGRPLSTQEISDKLKQRALTLVGGGFNTQLGGKSKSVGKGYRYHKRRKRKRQDLKADLSLPQEVVEQQMQFLSELNEMWNEYAWSLLLVDGDSNEHGERVGNSCGESSTRRQLDKIDLLSNNTMSFVMKRIASQRNPAFEWTGAKVRVEACHQYPTWVGREGILVGETKRTWRIIQIIGDSSDPSSTAGRKTNDETAVVETKQEPPNKKTKKRKETIADTGIKTLVLPKPKSFLKVILPLDKCCTFTNNRKEGGGGGGDDDDNSSSRCRNLCILLKDTKKDKRK